mgnify:CR=1 FL=1
MNSQIKPRALVPCTRKGGAASVNHTEGASPRAAQNSVISDYRKYYNSSSTKCTREFNKESIADCHVVLNDIFSNDQKTSLNRFSMHDIFSPVVEVEPFKCIKFSDIGDTDTHINPSSNI